MLTVSLIGTIALWLLYILIPIFFLYLGYLLVTRAFQDMGFSTFEAIIIVFFSFLFGAGFFDEFTGISFSNIYLFTYGSWHIGINTGGAIIPILLSCYLTIKNKLQPTRILFAIIVVALITFFVTMPDPEKGIVARFPYWLLPVIGASFLSLWFCWQQKKKAAPFAYTCGTIGVIIGADVFHLYTLISTELTSTRNAVIGGANVFDMVFLTGILAVVVDGIFIVEKRIKAKE
ncbi:MAG: DUF1614 domain-containing protein [Candidatus Thermoplasmatota archaeon]|nr:DUF1614 domain-containing protein [Candidatus Thermoplasmatota archaeon]MBU1941075.1 DUF1614 domain-containing protein [Candidatus Thermoplasmatota archaeon]